MVQVISPGGQYLYPEYQSSPLDVTTSTKNRSHLPYMSVLVPIVLDTSNSGQYQYTESKSSPLEVSSGTQSQRHVP